MKKTVHSLILERRDSLGEASQIHRPRHLDVAWRLVAPALVVSIGLHTWPVRGQGSLAPPGPPAPTMRSMQEIWDRMATPEAQTAALQNQVNAMQCQISAFLEAHGANLPWKFTTVDSIGDVGRDADVPEQ